MKLSKTVSDYVTLDDVEFEKKRDGVVAKTENHKIAEASTYDGGRRIDISHHVNTKHVSPADFVLLAKVANKLYTKAGGEPILEENTDERVREIVKEELDKQNE